MIVTAAVDLVLLEAELARAGVVVAGLGSFDDEQDRTNVHTYDDAGGIVDLPAEAAPVIEKHNGAMRTQTAAFEASEDAERLRLVVERSRADPAFAALAELTLKGTIT